MKSLKNLIILNILIFIISSSAGKSMLEKRSTSDDYSNEPIDSEPNSNEKERDGEPDECQESFSSHVDCRVNDISFALTNMTSAGRFYINGHSNDKACAKEYSKSSKEASLIIPFGKCDLEKNVDVQIKITVEEYDGILIENTESFDAKCTYTPYSSLVEAPVPQQEIPHNSDQSVNVTLLPEPTFNLTITMKKSDDPKDKGVVEAVITYSPDAVDVRAKNCYIHAKDNPNTKQKLTDENGCPVDSNKFSGWKLKKENKVLTSEFRPINFRDVDQTDIKCTMLYCHTASDCGPECTLGDSPRRKPCRGKSH